MKKHQIERLMRVSQKTGSPLIILDENKEEIVLLPLSSYERLVDEALMGADSFDDYIDAGLENEIDLDDECDIDELEVEDNYEEGSDVLPVAKDNNQEDRAEFNEEQFYLEPIE